jgi:thiosulfate/3-mercaptopyruvate sulfurtransferase
VAYANPHYLVETDWLATQLQEPNLRLVEVTAIVSSERTNRAKALCYDKQHIPGAVFLDVAGEDGGFTDANGEFPLTWPTQLQFEAAVGNLGIDNDSHVILYASTVGQQLYSCAMWCTRAWWIMHHYGVRCSILNGALEKWLAEGRPATSRPGHYPKATFRADPLWTRGIAYKQDVIDALRGDGTRCVVNALPAQCHLGTSDVVYGPRRGHITGSVNVPMPELVDWETGVFAQAQDMEARFREAGVLSADSVITYCGGGGCATTDGFALALLGYTRVAMYDNSLFEWGTDAALPMTQPDIGQADAQVAQRNNGQR